jgi:DNA primase
MSIIVNILENFLGTPRTHYEHKSQVGFDCPVCSQEKGLGNTGDGKGNLAINYEKGVYKCWSCWERNNMYGSLSYLVRKYGNKQHYKDFMLVAPDIIKNSKSKSEEDSKIIVNLPKSFKKFSEASPYHTNYSEAYSYVKKRGIRDETLEKYDIGYTCEGKHKNRVVIPSYDAMGKLNFYVARSFDKWSKVKYLNPEVEKQSIIFNEHHINWDSTIYLVEGGFDHIVTPNSIPLLGKFISDKLYHSLQSKAKGDVVIVLDGGEEEKKDALFLYNRLNTINLYGRIKVVFLKNGMDLSLINEKFGRMGIIKSLKTAHKIRESRL